MRAERIRYERMAAWTVVALIHAVLAWLITRLPVPELREREEAASTTDVFWIARPRVASPKRESILPAPMRQRARNTATRIVSDTQVIVPNPDETNVALETSPPVATFPGETMPTGEEASGSFRRDPLANRTVQLPGREAYTFRMRPPPSLASRVAKIGKLFGGKDYETNPCRSVRDSINELSQAGDSRVLQNALDYEKRFCR